MKKYYIYLLLVSLGWGGTVIAAKYLSLAASPLTITTLRWIIAVISLLPFVLFIDKTLRIPFKAILPIIGMSLSGVLLNNIFQFIALAHTTASNVGIITALNTVSVAIFTMIFFKEWLTIRQCFATIIALFGIVIVLTKGHVLNVLHYNWNVGDLWMLAAVSLWGFYTVCSRWAMRYTSALTSIFYAGLFGLIILLPFTVPSFEITEWSPTFIFSAIYIGLISTVLCMLLWNICVQKVGSLTCGFFMNFNPVIAVILSVLFFYESVTIPQIIGIITVLIGCTIFIKGNVTKTKHA